MHAVCMCIGRSDQTTIEREDGSVCDDIAGKGKNGRGDGRTNEEVGCGKTHTDKGSKN